jgi:hypothetical protein
MGRGPAEEISFGWAILISMIFPLISILPVWAPGMLPTNGPSGFLLFRAPDTSITLFPSTASFKVLTVLLNKCLAMSSVAQVMKPKPRERPVILSNMTTLSTISPNCSKKARNSRSVTTPCKRVKVQGKTLQAIYEYEKAVKHQLTVCGEPTNEKLPRIFLCRRNPS